MPLDSNALTVLSTGITVAFVSGVAHAPSDVVALAIAASYKAYSLNALSCAPAAPSKTNDSDLQDKLVEALQGVNPTANEAAKKWVPAFDAFWDGALFGATGTVLSVGGSSALELGLTGIFSNTSNALPASAQQIAQELEKYTKTVLVRDTALPPPSGCGPAPIS